MEVNKKIKNRTITCSSNLTFGYLSEELKTLSKRYLHAYVHCSIIHNSQKVETAKCLPNQWIQKM